MSQAQKHKFRFHDIGDVPGLSRQLATYFPHPEDYITGIYELLLNAVEHGNLGIGFETKSQLIRQGKWRDEVTRRLSLPKYAAREVRVTLVQDEHECRLTIADQGSGFSWRDYLRRPAPARAPNGRGLLIAFSSKFDRIAFNHTGNEVTCVVAYDDDKTALSA